MPGETCLECSAQVWKQDKGYDSRLLTENAYKVRKDSLKENSQTIYFGKDLGTYYSDYDISAFDVEFSDLAEMSDSPDEIYFDS